jgi:aspartate racemase
MPERVIGILGGQGPEATLDLYRRILEQTHAATDQEHFRTIIDCNPKTPNPNNAVTRGTQDPTQMLCATAQNLEKAGADFIVIPCNTVHIFLDAIRASIHIPVYSIVEETVKTLLDDIPNARKVALLASPAVVATRLYTDRLEAHGIETLLPDDAGEEKVREVIFAVKSGDKGAAVKEKLMDVTRDLVSRGAQAVILGCTELPLVLSPQDLPIPSIDTLDVLARAAVRQARS